MSKLYPSKNFSSAWYRFYRHIILLSIIIMPRPTNFDTHFSTEYYINLSGVIPLINSVCPNNKGVQRWKEEEAPVTIKLIYLSLFSRTVTFLSNDTRETFLVRALFVPTQKSRNRRRDVKHCRVRKSFVDRILSPI